MIVQTIKVSDCTPQTIVIGRRGTYDTVQIAFDLSYLVESYGNGVAVLAVKRSQDSSAYPAVVTQEENTLTWTVSETDTYYVGAGEAQLMWYVDGGLAKTIIYPMVVMRDILATAEEPPEGYENWIEHLTGLGAETQQNAQKAAQSATEAKASEDNAAESARKAEEAAGMLVGVSATATTLEPGESATAEYNDGVFEFGIPEGEKGDPFRYEDFTEAQKEELVQGPIKAAQDTAVKAVNAAGTTQTGNVNQAGTSAVNAVNQAGTTQVNAVNQAGATQVQAVEDKGDEVIDSIPSDYSDLTAEVNDLTRQISDIEENQIPDLKSALNNNIDVSSLGWVLGSLTSGKGTESSANTRIRSDYVAVSEGTKVEVSGNANCLIVYCFNEYKQWLSDSSWSDGNVFTVPSGTSFIRILIRKTSWNSEIASSEIVEQYNRCVITLALPQKLLVYRYTNDDVLNLIDSANFSSDILKHGYYQMNYKEFANKRWYLYNGNISIADASYRVSYPSIITLDYDVIMKVNDTNYEIYGYQYINSTWSYFVGSVSPVIKNGTQFVFTIKLVNEDTSITADAETFVSKVDIYTNVSDTIESSTRPAIKILTANDDAVNKIWASRWLRSSTASPLTLLWFSDIHRWVTPLKRIIEFKDYLTGCGILDDSIVTGDLVRNSTDEAQAFKEFWEDTPGTENILIALGNHDHYDVGTQPHGKATFAKMDSLFFKTVSDWDVVRESNYPFYYKDYADQKIRLIVADPAVTADEADEMTWLQQTLAGAKAADYSVVIAAHFLITDSATIYDNDWSNNLARDAGTDSMSYDWNGCDIVSAVTDFIAGGGKFVAYLIGHTHTDIIGYVTGHPDQLIINVASASDDRAHETPLTTNDLPRYENSRTQDCFNVVTVDATNSVIKCVRVGANINMYQQPRTAFSYNYSTKEFINLI